MKNKGLFLILIHFSFFMVIAAKFYLSIAEYYATNIYPVFLEAISYFTSKTSVSVAEIIIIILIITILTYIVVTIGNTVKYRTSDYVKDFFANVAVAIAGLYLLFVLFCGMNYFRYEFTFYSGLEIKDSSKEELVNLCEILIDDANEMRAELNTGEGKTALLFDHNYYGTAERAKASFSKISTKYKVLEGSYATPKIVKFSKIMSYMNITGVFFPYTFEANVNVDIPPYQIPSTMMHELVHLSGFMREDEANFISYLACSSSGYSDFAYSGTMLALTHSMNALYAEDYDLFEKLYKTYSEDVKNDLEFSRNYWNKFDTKVAKVSNSINDVYLKANNQQDGVKSYGRMVDLLLAYYKN